MKIAIVTDSTAYLPERIKDHPNLFCNSHPSHFRWKKYTTKALTLKQMNIMHC
jgi:hypothetical protein